MTDSRKAKVRSRRTPRGSRSGTSSRTRCVAGATAAAIVGAVLRCWQLLECYLDAFSPRSLALEGAAAETLLRVVCSQTACSFVATAFASVAVGAEEPLDWLGEGPAPRHLGDQLEQTFTRRLTLERRSRARGLLVLGMQHRSDKSAEGGNFCRPTLFSLYTTTSERTATKSFATPTAAKLRTWLSELKSEPPLLPGISTKGAVAIILMAKSRQTNRETDRPTDIDADTDAD